MKAISKNLKRIMKLKEISEKDLAKKIGVNRSAVNQWLSDKREPNAYSIIRICEALECTSDELLGLEIVPKLVEDKIHEVLEYADRLMERNDQLQKEISQIELENAILYKNHEALKKKIKQIKHQVNIMRAQKSVDLTGRVSEVGKYISAYGELQQIVRGNENEVN